MYRIEQASYGFRITATGRMDSNEAEQARLRLTETLASYGKPFSMIVDLRGLVPTEQEALGIIQSMQDTCKLMSLERAAVIVSSPVVRSQIHRISLASGTAESDRFIDASSSSDWEELALEWVTNGVEPSVAGGSASGARQ